MVRKYNIAKPEKYAAKDGQEKTYWTTVGTITEFEKQDGSISRLVEIPAIGLKANAFEQKPREQQPSQSVAPTSSIPQSTPEMTDEDISKIPF